MLIFLDNLTFSTCYLGFSVAPGLCESHGKNFSKLNQASTFSPFGKTISIEDAKEHGT